MLNQVLAKEAPARATAQSDVVSQVSNFIARYLQCSEHQRTVLALWVLHTYCSSVAQVTPYLSIQSAYKQSGKTLCLQLLSLLCDDPALISGFTASNLNGRMKHQPVSTLLLDECQATVGTRARSKAPVLRSLLASAFHRNPCGTATLGCAPPFCPKAFAGRGQLPEELADRAFPIILGPWGASAVLGFATDNVEIPGRYGFSRDGIEAPAGLAQSFSAVSSDAPMQRQPDAPIMRFHLLRATQEAKPLKKLLAAWAKQNLPHLEKLPPYSEKDFSPFLSPRRQDMAEPLLQLADAVGGEWPARIRQALTAIFEEDANFHLQAGLQLLRDIRDWFAINGHPERVSTAVLLEWMHTMPARPWDIDGPLNAGKLARLLAAFDIRPRLQRIGSTSPARGYLMTDFLEPWRRQLGFTPPVLHRPLWPAATQPRATIKGDEKPSELHHQKSEIANDDAVCNTTAHAYAPSMPGYPDGVKDIERSSLSPVVPGAGHQFLASNDQLTNLPNVSRSAVDYQIPDEEELVRREEQLRGDYRAVLMELVAKSSTRNHQ